MKTLFFKDNFMYSCCPEKGYKSALRYTLQIITYIHVLNIDYTSLKCVLLINSPVYVCFH